MKRNGGKTVFEQIKAVFARAMHGAPEGPSAAAPMEHDILAERLVTESARFVIRPLRADDAAVLRVLTDHPVVTEAISFLQSPFTLDAARALAGANTTVSDCFLGVRRKDDQALVAVVGVHLRGETTVEIGYWVGPAYHNQGYASEAVEAVVAKCEAALSGRQVYAECAPANGASVRVLTKLGFKETGARGIRPGRMIYMRPRPLAPNA